MPSRRLRVLLLADSCNPDWPSLPIVGFKYALALGRQADVVVATQIRNKPAIERVGPTDASFVFLDTEHIAAPIYRIATWLRGGNQVAWSTNMAMEYLPYLAFERAALRRFRSELRAGAFDIVHRITPMSPTLPSYAAGRVSQPFVLGPLNGNLPWPRAFADEQRREREQLRRLRNLYKALPFARSTYRHADLILTAFEHTRADLPEHAKSRVVMMPEIGFDPSLFHASDRPQNFSGAAPARFVFVGRLVPYKLAEAAVRALASSELLRQHRLTIVGDGPEETRLRDIVAETGTGDVICFEGRKTQSDVAQIMRAGDALVFPSIRELGAGVVIEAMASGMACIVADYGAPGALVASDRGFAVPVAPMLEMVETLRGVMEQCVTAPEEARRRVDAATRFAQTAFTWDRKAEITVEYYRDLVDGRSVVDRQEYW